MMSDFEVTIHNSIKYIREMTTYSNNPIYSHCINELEHELVLYNNASLKQIMKKLEVKPSNKNFTSTTILTDADYHEIISFSEDSMTHPPCIQHDSNSFHPDIIKYYSEIDHDEFTSTEEFYELMNAFNY